MRRVLIAVLFVLALGAAPARAADFVGMMVDGPLLTDEVDVGSELDLMRDTGVQSARFAMYWDRAQPYASAAEVPPEEADRFTDVAGVPTDFSEIDGVVRQLSDRGFSLLPVVVRAPKWARRQPGKLYSSPTAAGRDAYARFLTALVERYGPDGTLGLREPVRRWQIWNEPNGPFFWAEQPGIPAYLKLLRKAEAAVHAADPGAQVMLAGLFGKAWQSLRQVYRRGGRGLFDAVAVHPFTKDVRNVMGVIRNSRRVMQQAGDRKLPLYVTELAWPTAKGKVKDPYGFEVTPRGQAAKIRDVLARIDRRRKVLGIAGFFWSTWVSYDRDRSYPFDWAGLRRAKPNGKVVAKPGYRAFRKTVRRLF